MAVETIVPAILAILRLDAVPAAWVGSVVEPTMGLTCPIRVLLAWMAR